MSQDCQCLRRFREEAELVESQFADRAITAREANQFIDHLAKSAEFREVSESLQKFLRVQEKFKTLNRAALLRRQRVIG